MVNIRMYLPLLNLYIEIPLITVRTTIMNKSCERMVVEYVSLRISIYKWSFEFELYDTYRRRMNSNE